MKALPHSRFAAGILAGAVLLSSCSGSQSASAVPAQAVHRASSSTSPIQHVVLIVQENRTFNDFFATFPGADGTTTGAVARDPACGITQTQTIPLKKVNLVVFPQDLSHRYQGYVKAYDNGNMDGFDTIKGGNGLPECAYPYQYTDPTQIAPYWTMAQEYTLAEHMFTTHGSSSFVAHQDLIRGGTEIDSSESLINDPSGIPWGCDAPKGTKTSLVTASGVYQGGKGPYPCTKDFPSSYNYETLRDLLDAKYVSWKYYTPPLNTNYGGLMTAFDVIAAVRYGSEWHTNVTSPQTKIFNDITKGRLPSVSWVIPDEHDSDHPGVHVDYGPAWVSSVVNAIGESQYWNSTAIFVVWDDWGGLYDNLPPQQLGFGGLGFRVPAIVISPYARAGYISPTNYEFGSILRYIEDNWNLGRLGTSDERATSIIDSFDYTQAPIPFVTIPSDKDKSFFIHRKPTGLPPDDD